MWTKITHQSKTESPLVPHVFGYKKTKIRYSSKSGSKNATKLGNIIHLPNMQTSVSISMLPNHQLVVIFIFEIRL